MLFDVGDIGVLKQDGEFVRGEECEGKLHYTSYYIYIFIYNT